MGIPLGILFGISLGKLFEVPIGILFEVPLGILLIWNPFRDLTYLESLQGSYLFGIQVRIAALMIEMW